MNYSEMCYVSRYLHLHLNYRPHYVILSYMKFKWIRSFQILLCMGQNLKQSIWPFYWNPLFLKESQIQNRITISNYANTTDNHRIQPLSFNSISYVSFNILYFDNGSSFVVSTTPLSISLTCLQSKHHNLTEEMGYKDWGKPPCTF